MKTNAPAMSMEIPEESPLTPEETAAQEKVMRETQSAAPLRKELLPRDFDEALTSNGVQIPAGCERDLEIVPVRACFPKRLYCPVNVSKGVDVVNIIVIHEGDEVAFFAGRNFAAELFDGVKVEGKPRDKPYGFLPKVSADAGAKIVVRVRNTTTEDKPFAVVLAVDYLP